MAGVLLLAFNLRIATSEIPPVLPDLPLGELGKSLLVTIPVVCFSLAAFAGPPLRQILGEERGLALVVALLCIALWLRPSLGVWSLIVGTVICGLSVAVMNVMMPTLVRRRFPHQIGVMTAAYSMALSIGAGLTAGLTIPIRNAVGGSVDWALALWAIPATAAVLLWLPQLRWPRPVATSGRWAFGFLGDSKAWQITLYFGLQSVVFYVLLSWLPTIYRDKGSDPATAGAVLGIVTGLGILGNFAAPIAASRLRDQRLVVLVASLITIVGLLGVIVAPLWAAYLWAALLGVGAGGSFSVTLLMLASSKRPPAESARLSSMAQGMGYLIAAAGPPLAGLLHAATHAWEAALVMVLAISVAQLAAGMFAAVSGPTKRIHGLEESRA